MKVASWIPSNVTPMNYSPSINNAKSWNLNPERRAVDLKIAVRATCKIVKELNIKIWKLKSESSTDELEMADRMKCTNMT